MRIAVTGASGFIGSALVEHLQLRHEVVVLGRDIEKLNEKFGGRFSAFKYTDASEAFANADAVVHLAAALPGTLEDDDGYALANTELTIDLGRKAAAAGVGIFVNAATLGWNRNGYSRSKLAAERGLEKISGLNLMHVRLPAVYSQEFRGRLAFLNRVPRLMQGSLFTILASLRPTVSLARVCRAFEEAVLDGNPGERLVSDRQERNAVYAFAKAFIDYTFAFVVIIFFWWLLLLIYIAVRLDSPGSGIFAQERIGAHGKIFTCYKFRTMRVGTKVAGTHEVSESAVTRLGRMLRRTKVDELPQIINIIRGELSLVGPRPCLPVQHELIEARGKRGVNDVLPGITGLSQIQGIDMSDPERLAISDERYVALRSVLLDVKIIVQTLIGRGQGDGVARENL